MMGRTNEEIVSGELLLLVEEGVELVDAGTEVGLRRVKRGESKEGEKRKCRGNAKIVSSRRNKGADEGGERTGSRRNVMSKLLRNLLRPVRSDSGLVANDSTEGVPE